MALADILHAITAEADHQIAELRAAHDAAASAAGQAHQAALEHTRTVVRQQKDQRLHQMRSRAEGHAAMLTRHTLLRRKQEAIDALYDEVVTGLTKLPKDQATSFLQALLDGLPAGGVVHPTSASAALLKPLLGDRFTLGEVTPGAGGFRYVSARIDSDCTYETLVAEVLRPRTEVDTAHQLFGA
jgi:vacuolar-type H+-ATPase subunit E/Vma4